VSELPVTTLGSSHSVAPANDATRTYTHTHTIRTATVLKATDCTVQYARNQASSSTYLPFATAMLATEASANVYRATARVSASANVYKQSMHESVIEGTKSFVVNWPLQAYIHIHRRRL
jgi:hypothetical protein